MGHFFRRCIKFLEACIIKLLIGVVSCGVYNFSPLLPKSKICEYFQALRSTSRLSSTRVEVANGDEHTSFLHSCIIMRSKSFIIQILVCLSVAASFYPGFILASIVLSIDNFPHFSSVFVEMTSHRKRFVDDSLGFIYSSYLVVHYCFGTKTLQGMQNWTCKWYLNNNLDFCFSIWDIGFFQLLI